MFYVVCGLGGSFYVIPAEGLYHCRVVQIMDGPFSSAIDAHNRLGGIEVEFMLGETGEAVCPKCGELHCDCTLPWEDIHLGETDCCLGCSKRIEECICAEIEAAGRQYQDYLDERDAADREWCRDGSPEFPF